MGRLKGEESSSDKLEGTFPTQAGTVASFVYKIVTRNKLLLF